MKGKLVLFNCESSIYEFNISIFVHLKIKYQIKHYN